MTDKALMLDDTLDYRELQCLTETLRRVPPKPKPIYLQNPISWQGYYTSEENHLEQQGEERRKKICFGYAPPRLLHPVRETCSSFFTVLLQAHSTMPLFLPWKASLQCEEHTLVLLTWHISKLHLPWPWPLDGFDGHHDHGHRMDLMSGGYLMPQSDENRSIRSIDQSISWVPVSIYSTQISSVRLIFPTWPFHRINLLPILP